MGSDGKTNVIPLKSRDFTGLGFSICGNMRDGIYVKDLLHHGPASETGRIKAGETSSYYCLGKYFSIFKHTYSFCALLVKVILYINSPSSIITNLLYLLV